MVFTEGNGEEFSYPILLGVESPLLTITVIPHSCKLAQAVLLSANVSYVV